MAHSLEDGFTGGCQCGACRFSVAPGPVKQTLCHCRMCQRAVGGPFAALAEVGEARVRWDGSPASFRSSNIAERGFCPRCGTPLFYRQIGGGTIEFTAGALDRPQDYQPIEHHGVESRLPWLTLLDGLPGHETVLAEGVVLESCQDKRGSC